AGTAPPAVHCGEAGRVVPRTPGDTPVRKTSEASSSDFDLSLEAKVDQSPLELSSGEMAALPKSDEDVTLGEMPPPAVTGASDSGINLQEPADSGISLEKGGEGSSSEIEFELSLDAETTPKPAPAQADSSSEFELTLEDSARLAPLDEDSGKQGEKDIFETDFEVPALEDESGSQAVALDESDTDLESSDFDLALGEEDVATEEESGSQVVALEDEEEVDEGAATVARPASLLEKPAKGKKKKATEEAEEVAEPEIEGEAIEAPIADQEVLAAPRAAVRAAPADWGVLTPMVLLVSVLVMLVLGMMSFELVRGMWGYRQNTTVGSFVIKAVGGLFGYEKEFDVN